LYCQRQKEQCRPCTPIEVLDSGEQIELKRIGAEKLQRLSYYQ